MAGELRPLATELTRLPVGAPHPGCTAVFAFEMFYAMGNFAPGRSGLGLAPIWCSRRSMTEARLQLLSEQGRAVGTGGKRTTDGLAMAAALLLSLLLRPRSVAGAPRRQCDRVIAKARQYRLRNAQPLS